MLLLRHALMTTRSRSSRVRRQCAHLLVLLLCRRRPPTRPLLSTRIGVRSDLSANLRFRFSIHEASLDLAGVGASGKKVHSGPYSQGALQVLRGASYFTPERPHPVVFSHAPMGRVVWSDEMRRRARFGCSAPLGDLLSVPRAVSVHRCSVGRSADRELWPSGESHPVARKQNTWLGGRASTSPIISPFLPSGCSNACRWRGRRWQRGPGARAGG